MMGFVVYLTGTGDVLLDDGSWAGDDYEARFVVHRSLVRANRRVAFFRRVGWSGVAVCPWEMPDEPEEECSRSR